jgi:hypothetical protein
MADFDELSEIISRCMGLEDNKFVDAYYNNIGLQIEAAIESSPVGTSTNIRGYFTDFVSPSVSYY